jgi:hypothetical protein
MQNVTAGTNRLVGSVDFSGGEVNFYFTNFQSITIHSNDVIAYVPGTDSTTLSIPFSDFNPGTYSDQGSIPGFTYNTILTVETVPEPCWLALSGLGALIFCSCRRGGRLRTR